MKPDSSANPLLIPSMCLVVGGALWGLFWLPVRALSEYGLMGAWPGALIYTVCILVLLPIAVLRRRQIAANWLSLAVCGMFTGAAFSLYATSLLLADVVRVLLLFYITPVWGTLLGIAVLGERLTYVRCCALALGIAGLLVVLGTDNGWPLPRNLGEWLALGSGMAWAYGSLRLYQMKNVAVPDQLIAFIGGGLVVTIASILFGGSKFGGPADPEVLIQALPASVLVALYVLPMLALTIWPATMLTPGRVGLLLMSEVVVGIGSAAVLSGEPFGWREGVGTFLIVSAGFVEVIGKSSGTETASSV